MTAWGSVAELLGEDLEDVELLGRGSSGVVYRARQRSLGRTVAVKVFNQFADDADRVLAEARAQAGLSWHANIVSLYGQGLTADGFPYLVMEYAGGGSLKDRIEADGPLSDPELLMVGAGLATALDAAHRAGVVHCDVKPSNVLFASDGSVRLADFGIAKSAGVSTGTIDSVEGSLGYVAPELLDGERQAAANDVYSLAITLSFARSGQAPLPDDLTLAQAIAAVHAGVPAAEARLDGLPEPVGRLLRDSCSTRPSGRPGASDLADAMWEATRSPAGQADGPGARNRWSRMVAAGALVAVVALLGVLLARSPEPAAIPVVDEEPAFDLC
ncbi:MAG: serine/threonine protein kinase, partial [Microthrixaceae bacterium]|nr:serine/threonine protein kinase [Microthrixaceae bacterium]